MVSLSITGLVYLETAHLDNQYPRKHVPPGMVKLTQEQAFYILISGFHKNALTYHKAKVAAPCIHPQPFSSTYLNQHKAENQQQKHPSRQPSH